jgi:RNA polymerase sigma-70 factor, ECF subfamily
MPPDGPEDEAGRLYDAFGASLYRYALMLLADHAAAEDVLQQVFVTLVSRRRVIDDPERYLRRAVRNACYSMLRVRRSAHRVDRDRDGQILLESVPASTPGLSDAVRLALDVAVRQLPPDQREVVHLHVFEGRTFREVAELTDEPLNTVASRYRYALEKLRAMLTDEKS